MALKIKHTPPLYGKSADEFERQADLNLTREKTIVEIEKINKAYALWKRIQDKQKLS